VQCTALLLSASQALHLASERPPRSSGAELRHGPGPSLLLLLLLLRLVLALLLLLLLWRSIVR